jgi:hypothetical protein
MYGQSYNLSYCGRPVSDIINNEVDSAENDFLLYIMGPYTAFDAERAYDNAQNLKSPYIDDPLFDPDEHVVEEKAEYEKALSDLCDSIRNEIRVRPFIATDIDIPTRSEAVREELSENGLPVLDQSVAFAAVSDAVIFIYSVAGLNAGPGSEVGAILGEFNLRYNLTREAKKPRERFRIFCGPDFSSGSICEIPESYGVDLLEYNSKREIISQMQSFLINIERKQREEYLPIFNSSTQQ